jgi:hypothetical protein
METIKRRREQKAQEVALAEGELQASRKAQNEGLDDLFSIDGTKGSGGVRDPTTTTTTTSPSGAWTRAVDLEAEVNAPVAHRPDLGIERRAVAAIVGERKSEFALSDAVKDVGGVLGGHRDSKDVRDPSVSAPGSGSRRRAPVRVFAEASDLSDWDEDERGGGSGSGSGRLKSTAGAGATAAAAAKMGGNESDWDDGMSSGDDDVAVRNTTFEHKLSPTRRAGWGERGLGTSPGGSAPGSPDGRFAGDGGDPHWEDTGSRMMEGQMSVASLASDVSDHVALSADLERALSLGAHGGGCSPDTSEMSESMLPAKKPKASIPPQEDPLLSAYVAMLRKGVPIVSVCAKMRLDGEGEFQVSRLLHAFEQRSLGIPAPSPGSEDRAFMGMPDVRSPVAKMRPLDGDKLEKSLFSQTSCSPGSTAESTRKEVWHTL